MLVHTIPRAHEVECSKRLRQRYGFVYDALLLVIVTNLYVSGQREILAERMTIEPVIRQYSAKIRVFRKKHAV